MEAQETTGSENETEEPGLAADAPRPPAKIHPEDAFTLISRTIASLLLSGLAVFYGFTGNYGVMVPLALVALLVQYATIRLIRRIREQNKDFIAWRAAQEQAERERRAAARASSKGSVRP